MVALKPFLFLVTTLAAGAALAAAALATGAPTGWIGAAALIGWALVARRRWAKLETRHLEPGAPERILWLRLAGVALILGHSAGSLFLVGDDLHVGRGNTLAIDNWTLIAAVPIAALLFRRDRNEKDERHAPIVALGVRTAYVFLIVTLIPLALYLAFAPPPAQFPGFVVAQFIIELLLASYAAMLLAQLIAYARDAEEMRRAEAGQPFP